MSRRLLVVLLGWMCAVAAATGAAAQGFGDSTHPILRIETGMHGGIINRLALVGDEMVTVSDDKTMRRWSLPDGQPHGIWRVPVGGGDSGALYALAISGSLAVVGGRTGDQGFGLFFFDLPSGRMLGTVAGFAQPISALAFAEGGTLLAIGMQRQGGIEVIDVKSHKIVAQDRNYGATVNWLTFSSTGKLASSSADGKIRYYGHNLGQPSATQPMGDGDMPWGLAFSPDGALLAVGSVDAARVGLYVVDGLQRASVMSGAEGASGSLSVVSWNADGTVLAAAGQYKSDAGHYLVRFWPMRGDKIVTTDRVVSPDTITDIGFRSDDTVAYVTGQGSFGILGTDGRSRLSREAPHCDYRDIGHSEFLVSPNGSAVEFACRHGDRNHFRVDLADVSFQTDPAPRKDLHGPAATATGIRIEDWQNGTAPRLNGKRVELDPSEHVRAVAAAQDRPAIVLGTDFFLRFYTSTEEIWRRGLPAAAWSVAVTDDRRYVVAALGDGTIRWYKAADGSEVLSFYLDAHDRRWIVWTQEGFFEDGGDGPAGNGASLAGFQFNHGAGALPDFVPASKLYASFHRRNLVHAKFSDSPAEAQSIAAELAGLGDSQTLLNGGGAAER